MIHGRKRHDGEAQEQTKDLFHICISRLQMIFITESQKLYQGNIARYQGLISGEIDNTSIVTSADT